MIWWSTEHPQKRTDWRRCVEYDSRFVWRGGRQFRPMYNFNQLFRSRFVADAQYDESANLKEYRVGEYYSGDLKFSSSSFSASSFSVGLSLRAELVMPVFSINVASVGTWYTAVMIQKGSIKFWLSRLMSPVILFLHVGYQLSKFKDPNNLMLGLGYRFHDKRWKSNLRLLITSFFQFN